MRNAPKIEMKLDPGLGRKEVRNVGKDTHLPSHCSCASNAASRPLKPRYSAFTESQKLIIMSRVVPKSCPQNRTNFKHTSKNQAGMHTNAYGANVGVVWNEV